MVEFYPMVSSPKVSTRVQIIQLHQNQTGHPGTRINQPKTNRALRQNRVLALDRLLSINMFSFLNNLTRKNMESKFILIGVLIDYFCLRQPSNLNIEKERPESSCRDPGGISNGTRTGRSFKHHDTVNYDCNHGYRLVGSRIRICLISGTWSGIPPKCHGKFSASLQCGSWIFIPSKCQSQRYTPTNKKQFKKCF